MTAEELSGLAMLQRSIDRLTDNFEKLDVKLDGQIAATSLGFQDVKIDLVSVKGDLNGVKQRFIGGWLVVAGVGGVVAVVVGWIIQLHPHIQF